MSKTKRNQRDCPAAGQPVSSQECGAGRMSRWTCPAECPFNPWAPEQYEEMLEIDSRLTGKMMMRFGTEQRKGIVQAEDLPAGPVMQRESIWVRRFFYDCDAAGRTFFKRWEAERFADLSNDERVLLGFMARTRPMLFEVHGVRDGELDGVDLLDESRARLDARDYKLSERALRFSVFFMWLVELPFYARFHGGGIEWPEVSEREPEEVLEELATHLGAPAETAPRLEWLAVNFGRMCDAALAVAAALRQRTLEGIDAKFFKTTYRVQGSVKSLVDRLERREDVVADDLSDEEFAEGFEAGFTWLEGGQAQGAQQELAIFNPAPIAGVPILGRVLLGPKQVRIEASSAARNAPLRARFEKMAGAQVEFARERVDDLARQVLGDIPEFDPALVPPSLLACAPQIMLQSSIMPPEESAQDPGAVRGDMLRRHHERWLDDPIPMLEGRTPRAAANEPALRPRLIRMMKTMIRRADQDNREHGAGDDLNWMLETLGLHEIIVEPPRHRESDDDLEDDFEDDDDAPYFSAQEIEEAARPDPPVRVLDEAEAEKLMDAQMTLFPTDEAMLNAFFDEAGDLIQLVADFTADWFDEKAQARLLNALSGAYFLLFPPGTERPAVNGARLDSRFETQLQELESILAKKSQRDPEYLLVWLQQCRQPVLVSLCGNIVLAAATEGPRKHRISMEDVPVMFAFIKAAIDELDCLRA